MGLCFGDLDHDGKIDFFSTATYERGEPAEGDGNRLYFNLGNRSFGCKGDFCMLDLGVILIVLSFLPIAESSVQTRTTYTPHHAVRVHKNVQRADQCLQSNAVPAPQARRAAESSSTMTTVRISTRRW